MCVKQKKPFTEAREGAASLQAMGFTRFCPFAFSTGDKNSAKQVAHSISFIQFLGCLANHRLPCVCVAAAAAAAAACAAGGIKKGGEEEIILLLNFLSASSSPLLFRRKEAGGEERA